MGTPPLKRVRVCMLAVAALLLVPATASAAARATVFADADACTFGTFDVGNWPGACWRPYSPASPFNRVIPPNPRLAPNSARIVSRLASWGRPENRLKVPASRHARDYYHPWYLSRPGDPRFRVHCTAGWGRCAVEGRRVRIPDAARPANGPDAHMAVVDQSSGWEYDFYGVRSKPRGGGRLTVRWGGRTRVTGPHAMGLGGDATASGFGLLAGVVRGPEAAALEIPHALFMNVECTGGRAVWPAHGTGRLCRQIGVAGSHAPRLGTHFQLAMSDAQIDALHAPPLQAAILRAMAHYGMFVGDTGTSPWGLTFESDATYTSFGRRPALRAAFRRSGAHHYRDSLYNMWVLDTVPVDWAHRLRVIAPCVAHGRC